MAVPYVPSASDLSRLGTYKEYIPAWMSSNQGTLCKIGGKQVILTRHHDAQQYNPLYFDREKAIVFPGTFTDSGLAARLELMVIQLAFSLGIGVNKTRDSAYGWMPHNASFGFLDIASAALGVFASLDRF
jgi:hypothetical protein